MEESYIESMVKEKEEEEKVLDFEGRFGSMLSVEPEPGNNGNFPLRDRL